MTGTKTDVVVVGSANRDVVLTVAALPRPGETVVATGRSSGTGGKGANQAIAAARSGARTTFVGALGDDVDGRELLESLTRSGVDPLARTSSAATGTAYVLVDAAGENSIVVDAGANETLHDLTDAELEVVTGGTVLLCQLEIPLATVRRALQAARGAGVLTVLNAAPGRSLPAEVLNAVDLLVVNEQEALAVAGNAGTVEDAVRILLQAVPDVVVTLGGAGALVAQREAAPLPVPAFAVRRVVDTTGAGDAFCGALAAARARGEALVDAARTACAAASLAVEVPGAGGSAPTLAEIMARLSQG